MTNGGSFNFESQKNRMQRSSLIIIAGAFPDSIALYFLNEWFRKL